MSQLTKQRDLAGLSILVVEDEVFVAKTLEKVFADYGAKKVDVALLLNSAEQMLAKQRYDAVVLDLRLPDGEALELAMGLLAKKVPVVIHSGHACYDLQERFPNAAYCPKPSAPYRLVESVLEGRAAFSR